MNVREDIIDNLVSNKERYSELTESDTRDYESMRSRIEKELYFDLDLQFKRAILMTIAGEVSKNTGHPIDAAIEILEEIDVKEFLK